MESKSPRADGRCDYCGTWAGDLRCTACGAPKAPALKFPVFTGEPAFTGEPGVVVRYRPRSWIDDDPVFSRLVKPPMEP